MKKQINCLSCGYVSDVYVHAYDEEDGQFFCPVCSCEVDDYYYDEEED